MNHQPFVSQRVTQAVCYERPSRDPGGKGPTGGSHVAAANGPDT